MSQKIRVNKDLKGEVLALELKLSKDEINNLALN